MEKMRDKSFKERSQQPYKEWFNMNMRDIFLTRRLRMQSKPNQEFVINMRDNLFLESEREEERKNKREKTGHILSSLLIPLPNVTLHVHF